MQYLLSFLRYKENNSHIKGLTSTKSKLKDPRWLSSVIFYWAFFAIITLRQKQFVLLFLLKLNVVRGEVQLFLYSLEKTCRPFRLLVCVNALLKLKFSHINSFFWLSCISYKFSYSLSVMDRFIFRFFSFSGPIISTSTYLSSD